MNEVSEETSTFFFCHLDGREIVLCVCFFLIAANLLTYLFRAAIRVRTQQNISLLGLGYPSHKLEIITPKLLIEASIEAWVCGMLLDIGGRISNQ